MNRSLVVLSLGVLAMAACDDDTMTEPLVETLDLQFSGLEPLTNGFHYEGWAIIDGSAVSTGKFNVDGSGGLTTVAGDPIPGGSFMTGIDISKKSDWPLKVSPSWLQVKRARTRPKLAGTLSMRQLPSARTRAVRLRMLTTQFSSSSWAGRAAAAAHSARVMQ